ncbi:unnamed protein product, partial [Lymnaea stagnalis]
DVFIGLKRDVSSYGQRFRWINDLPLAYTAWDGGEPLGGHIQGCTVWNFNVTYENINDGWFSIGCGYKNARYFMCESKKAPQFRDGRMPNISKASDRSVRAAVARG